MPWGVAYLGYGVGSFPPGRASYTDFLKAAPTINLVQGMACWSIKAASAKATVGSAYGMSPVCLKTDSSEDRAVADRYHAFNNLYFLETAIHGRYPNAFVVPTPYEQMGFRSGDDKIMQVPLDWIGFHYYTRGILSDARGSRKEVAGTIATETQDTAHGGDPWTQLDATMASEDLLTDGGLEVYPLGIYDLVTRMSREYNNRIIEITESGCSYLDIFYPPTAASTRYTRPITVSSIPD